MFVAFLWHVERHINKLPLFLVVKYLNTTVCYYVWLFLKLNLYMMITVYIMA